MGDILSVNKLQRQGYVRGEFRSSLLIDNLLFIVQDIP